MLKLGLDFDNTLISYDLIFYETAREFKLIPKELKKIKNCYTKFFNKSK